MLIDNGADVNAKNEYGETPLHDAADAAYGLTSPEKTAELTEIVNILLDNGADIDAENKWGKTPLLYATWIYPDAAYISKILIERGADVNAKGYGDITPLHYAAMWRSEAGVEVVKLLIVNGADVNAKIIADDRGDDDLRLVGYTPLDFAARGRGKRGVSESPARQRRVLQYDNGVFVQRTARTESGLRGALRQRRIRRRRSVCAVLG